VHLIIFEVFRKSRSQFRFLVVPPLLIIKQQQIRTHFRCVVSYGYLNSMSCRLEIRRYFVQKYKIIRSIRKVKISSDLTDVFGHQSQDDMMTIEHHTLSLKLKTKTNVMPVRKQNKNHSLLSLFFAYLVYLLVLFCFMFKDTRKS